MLYVAAIAAIVMRNLSGEYKLHRSWTRLDGRTDGSLTRSTAIDCLLVSSVCSLGAPIEFKATFFA